MNEDHIIKRIGQLTVKDKKLLSLKLRDMVHSGALKIRKQNQKQLNAYVNADQIKNTEDLKSYIKRKMPDYMVPSNIYKINEFPLLPNGKIDKSRLRYTSIIPANSKGDIPEEINQPKNDIEKKLIHIYEEVLGFSPIKVDDNFFEIGGDSILSIQIIAKARKTGINISANQLFEYQSIAELILFLENSNSIYKNSSITHGEVALTPIQYWFFDTHIAAPHFWNQIVELKYNSSDISSKTMEFIATKLVIHHDTLRSGFVNKEGKWKAFILKTDSIKPFYEINLGSFTNIHKQEIEIQKNIETIQQNLNLEEGSLFKILYFNCGENKKNRIYLIAHHLIIDYVSWNIIFQDIQHALELITENEDVSFGKKTDSIKKWGDYLDRLIKSEGIINELPYWTAQRNDLKQLPIDFEVNSKVYSENSINNFSVIIDENRTSTLLIKASEIYNSKIEDLLITTLVKTICEWADMDYLCLGLERQGRALEDNSIDISNTVGWFTSYFPIMLENNPVKDIGEKIKSVKEQLNQIPNNGLGYGILKYLSNKNNLDLDIKPQVIFNYLGTSHKSFDDSILNFQFHKIGARSEWSERTYPIEVNTYVTNGKLNISWSYTHNLFKETTFLELAKTYETNLNELINYCKQKENIDYTPSDFPESGLSQEDLDNLMELL